MNRITSSLPFLANICLVFPIPGTYRFSGSKLPRDNLLHTHIHWIWIGYVHVVSGYEWDIFKGFKITRNIPFDI